MLRIAINRAAYKNENTINKRHLTKLINCYMKETKLMG